MKRIYIFLFFILSVSTYAQICECTNCPAALLDNATANAELNVITNCANDLGVNPLQQVCFTIQHGYISDLAISLTAPSGLQYLIMGDNDNSTYTAPAQQNIDVCITVGTGTPLTDGSTFTCNGAPPNCLEGNWTVYSAPTNNNAPPTMGPPCPNQDLNDFNVPGDPVAGLWTLDVADVVAQFQGTLVTWSLTFLDMTCIGPCFTCEAEGGTLQFINDVVACEGSADLNIAAPPFYPAATPAPDPADYSYTYLISQNGLLIAYEPGPNLMNYAVGAYDICGLSYYTLDAANLPPADGTVSVAQLTTDLAGNAAPFCGDVSEDCLSVQIVAPPADTYIDTTICFGDVYPFDGVNLFQDGMYNATFTTPAGCDSVVFLTLDVRDEAVMDTFPILCAGESVTFLNLTFNTGGNFPLFTQTPEGCDSTINLYITYLDANAVIQPAPDLDCNNPMVILDASQSTLTATPGGTLDYQWYLDNAPLVGQNSLGLSVNVAGEYVFEVVHSFGGQSCIAYDTIVINSSLTNMSLDIPPVPELNCINDTLSINADIVISNNNYTITWMSSPSGNIVGPNDTNPIFVNAAGTYYAELHDIASDCSLIDSVVVSADFSLPDISISGMDITCGNPVATLTGSSTTPNSMPQWTGVVNDPTLWEVTVTTADTYYLQVTGQNGCTALDSIMVVLDANIPTVSAGVDTTITCGNPCVNLDGSASSFGPNIIYFWSGPGIDASNMNEITPEVCLQGNYIFTLTDTITMCTQSDDMDIVLWATLPTASAQVTGIITCAIDSVLLDNVGSDLGADYSVEWSGPGINASNINADQFMVGDTGMYILTILNDVTNCFASDTVFVGLDQLLPMANAGIDTSISCASPSVNLDGGLSTTGPEFQFNWSGPAINNSNENSSNPLVNQPGTYILNISSTANGCVSEPDTVIVTSLDNIPIADAGSDQTFNCNVSNIFLSVANPAADINYTWTLPDFTSSPNDVNATQLGNYVLTATDPNNGCFSTDTVQILSDFTPPFAIAGVDSLLTCKTTSVTLDGTTSVGDNVAYHWAGGDISGANESQSQPSVSMPGTYTLIVTNDVNGCQDTTTINVDTNYTAPIVNVQDTLVLNCTYENLIANLNNSSAGSDFQYEWSGNGIDATNQNGANQMFSQEGLYTLVITNTENGCAQSDVLTVIEDKILPDASTEDVNIDCINPTALLTGTSMTTFAQMAWMDLDGVVHPGGTFLVDEAGNYTFIVTGLNGCVNDNEKAAVTGNFLEPDVSAEDGIIDCINTSVSLTGQSNTANVSYTWTDQNQIVISNDASVDVTTPGFYTVEALGDNGCTSTDVAEVIEEKDLPVFDLEEAGHLDCVNEDSPINIQNLISGNYEYNWSGTSDNFEVLNESIIVHEPGNYALALTNIDNGCTTTKNIDVVSSVESPSAALSVNDVNCFGDSDGAVTISSVGNGQSPYAYALGNSDFSSNPIFTNLEAGEYTYQVQDANGCLWDTLIEIQNPQQINIEIVPFLESINLGDSTSLNLIVADPDNIDTIIWMGDISSQQSPFEVTVKPIQSTTYTAQLVDLNGCTTEAYFYLNVETQRDIFVPYVFTPNQDGVNDFAFVQGGSQIQEISQFTIVDRWGEIVFQKEHFQPNIEQMGWNGFHNGKNMNNGVYLYFVKVLYIDGLTSTFKGDITLMH